MRQLCRVRSTGRFRKLAGAAQAAARRCRSNCCWSWACSRVVPGVPLSSALTLLYGAARREVLDSVVRFDPVALATLRADFSAIRQALRPSGPVPGVNADG